MVFVFLWLTWLSVITSKSIHILQIIHLGHYHSCHNNRNQGDHFPPFLLSPFHFLKNISLPIPTSKLLTNIVKNLTYAFFLNLLQFSSVQSLNRVQLLVTPWIEAHQASLSITNSRSSLRLMSIESVMPSNHLILCCPLLLLPAVPPSIRVFSNESTLCMRWPKYWSLSFSIIPSKEIPGLISFRNGLVGSPCSPRDSQESSPTPQFKSINSSALSFLHSPTLTSIHDHWKSHSLDQTDLCWQSNVSALNMLSRLVITFLPTTKVRDATQMNH